MEKEQEEQYPHPDFVKGFNEGYALAKYAPEIGGVFGMYAGESERGRGFAKGKDQYVSEKVQERDQSLKRDAADNKSDASRDIRLDAEQLERLFDENRSAMDVKKDDNRMPSLLRDLDENKSDVGLDQEREQSKDDYEPERD